MKANKYRYLEVIQGNYGYGWEDLSEYENNYLEARKDLKEYRLGCPYGSHRIISRRELSEVQSENPSSM